MTREKKPITPKRGRKPLPPPTPLARLIRETREARRLTIAGAAAKIDTHEATWRQWESGRREPDLRSRRRIAEALEIELGRLL